MTYRLFPSFACYKQGCSKPKSLDLCSSVGHILTVGFTRAKGICILICSKYFQVALHKLGFCLPPATYEHACFPRPTNELSNFFLILANSGWKWLACSVWLPVLSFHLFSTCPHASHLEVFLQFLHFSSTLFISKKFFFLSWQSTFLTFYELHFLCLECQTPASLESKGGVQVHSVTVIWTWLSFLVTLLCLCVIFCCLKTAPVLHSLNTTSMGLFVVASSQRFRIAEHSRQLKMEL